MDGLSCREMVFLPYTPRPGAAADGYEDWLRRIDNPFFNGVPGILRYTNWRVAEVLSGAADFTHFDFMLLNEELGDSVWSNREVIDFAAGWTRSWGSDPDNDDLSVNYNSYKTHHVRGDSGRLGRTVILGLDVREEALPPGTELWRVSEPMVGRPDYTAIGIRPDEGSAGASEWARTILRGEIIAAP